VEARAAGAGSAEATAAIVVRQRTRAVLEPLLDAADLWQMEAAVDLTATDDEQENEQLERRERLKRRRCDGRTTPHDAEVVELSDGEDGDMRLAMELQRAERTRLREVTEADARLARQLQEAEEEEVRARARELPPPPPPGRMGPGYVLNGGDAAQQQQQQQQQRWDWRARLQQLRDDDSGWAPWGGGGGGGGGLPHPPPGWGGGHGGRGRLPSAAQSRHAHLAFVDRDFTEDDYDMLLRLDEVGGAKKKRTARANAKVIEQLAVRKLTRAEAREDNNCAVCLEPLRAQQAVLTLPCKHEYHKTCIIKWLKQSDAPTCPVCKAPALPPDGGPESDAGAASTHADEECWSTG